MNSKEAKKKNFLTFREFQLTGVFPKKKKRELVPKREKGEERVFGMNSNFLFSLAFFV
jgi:hypothetical protein